MKGNVADWRKMNLAAMKTYRHEVEDRHWALEKELADLTTVITGLEEMQLRSRSKTVRHTTVKGHKHWTKRPPTDPTKRKIWQAKVDAWRKKMAKAAKNGHKAKAVKRG